MATMMAGRAGARAAAGGGDGGWQRTAVMARDEWGLFRQWAGERLHMAEAAAVVRAVLAAQHLGAGVDALAGEDRGDWLRYRDRAAARLGARFAPDARLLSCGHPAAYRGPRAAAGWGCGAGR